MKKTPKKLAGAIESFKPGKLTTSTKGQLRDKFSKGLTKSVGKDKSGDTSVGKKKGKGKKALGIVGGALEAIGAGLTSAVQTMGGDSYASGVSKVLSQKAASRSGFQLKSGNNAAFKDMGAEKKEELDEATRRTLYKRAKNRGDKKGMKIYKPRLGRTSARFTKSKK